MPETPREMVEALECTVATMSIGWGKWRDNLLGLHWGQTPRLLEPELHWERTPPESHPTYGTPQDEPIPIEPDVAPARPTGFGKYGHSGLHDHP